MPENERARVWYLGHSGFAVKTSGHFLIFDYYLDEPAGEGRSLSTGVIEPAGLREENVVVFASHRHPDHFSRVILGWQEQLPRLTYVLSRDIRAARELPGAVVARAGESFETAGVRIKTLRSTDEGVAFLVETDGVTLYHAGDLNWWHWQGEPKDWNDRMERRFKAEIDSLRGTAIDAAFAPADPRQGEQALWGLGYLMDTVAPARVFPMHFWEEFSIFDRIEQDPAARGWKDRAVRITGRGQCFSM